MSFNQTVRDGKRKRKPARNTREEDFVLVRFVEDGVLWVSDKVDLLQNGVYHQAPYYGVNYNCVILEESRDKDSLLKKMKTVDNQGQATMSSRKKTLQQKSRDDPDNDQGDKDSLLRKMKTVDNQGQATMSSRKKTVQQKSRDDPDNDQETADKERILLNREERLKKQRKEMAERNRQLKELAAQMEEYSGDEMVSEPEVRNSKGYPCHAQKEPRKRDGNAEIKECTSCQQYKNKIGAQLQELEMYKKRCSILAAEVQSYKDKLKEAEETAARAAAAPATAVSPQPAHPCARPRCGYVSAEEAAKYNMQELQPGSSIYVYRVNVAEAQGKPSGGAAARYLLGLFFKHKELPSYSLAEEGDRKEGLLTIDPNLIDAIIKYCITTHKAKRSEIRRALASKITAARCKYSK